MQIDELKQLYRHMDWADSVVWKAVMASDLGPMDTKLQETLLHLHHTQRAFLELWTSQPPTIGVELKDFDSVGHLRDWAKAYYPRALAYLESLTPEELNEPLEIPWTKFFEEKLGGPAAPVTLSQTIYQVVAHSNHHRGQASARLKKLGETPPLVDHIVWLWMSEPEPVWPE